MFRNKVNIFLLLLDESIKVISLANLLVFIRFELNGDIEEKMLFCQSFPTTTIDEKIFKSAENVMKKNQLNWFKCVGLTTNRTRAMSGIHSRLITKVKSIAPIGLMDTLLYT